MRPRRRLVHLVWLFVISAGSGLAAGPAGARWSQGDPSSDEQVILEWLNAARQNPVAVLTQLLNAAAADPVTPGLLAGLEPATPAQLAQALQNAWTLAQANSAAYPRSAAISTAPLALYPLFMAQASAWGAQAALPAPLFPSGRSAPAYFAPVPLSGILLAGAAHAISGLGATGAPVAFGPYGGTYSELAQANLYDPVLSGRDYVFTLLTQPGSGSPPPAFLVQGDPLPDLTLGHTRMAGVALTPQPDGSRVLTLFAGSQEFFTQSDLPFGTATVFITGVAYQDNQGSGHYAAGEGLGQITVTTTFGSWYAVTATAGGYAIPVPAGAGAGMVTADGGPFHHQTAAVQVGADNVKLDWVQPAAAVAPPVQVLVPASEGVTQFIGISTRGLVQTGAAVLTGGFVISGPTAARKQLLIRAVGPSLQSAGFPAALCLPATQLQVFSGATLLASNTGWTSAPDGGAAAAQAAIAAGDFPLTAWAGGGGDSALVTTLSPGAYTVAVTPAPGAPTADLTGKVGLVEIYDLTPADGSRLINLSTRGLTGAGPTQLVAGWTLSGSGHRRTLLRGAGPALATEFALPGVLAQPALTLYGATGAVVAVNTNWAASAQSAQINSLGAAAGAFALPPAGGDAALLVSLAPGNATASLGAAPGAEPGGIALLELYELP